jgi:hypothetical protein
MNRERIEAYAVALISVLVVILLDEIELGVPAQAAVYAILAGVGVYLPARGVARSFGVTTPPPDEIAGGGK